MANYHKRNSIRAVQWDPENAQSFEDIKKLIAENPGIGWIYSLHVESCVVQDAIARLVTVRQDSIIVYTANIKVG